MCLRLVGAWMSLLAAFKRSRPNAALSPHARALVARSATHAQKRIGESLAASAAGDPARSSLSAACLPIAAAGAGLLGSDPAAAAAQAEDTVKAREQAAANQATR